VKAIALIEKELDDQLKISKQKSQTIVGNKPLIGQSQGTIEEAWA
jgi:hypothetical protein